jgi:hypothetical protein
MSKWSRLLADIASVERQLTFWQVEAVEWERRGFPDTAKLYRQGIYAHSQHLESLKAEKERLQCLVNENMGAAKSGSLIEASDLSDAKMAPTYSFT